MGTHRVGTVTNTYAYNGFGQRVRKFASTGATSTVIYVYDHQGKLIGEYSNTGAAIREYVWMQGEPLAVFTPNGTNPPNVFFLHNDHLGTPRVAMDGASNIRWRWLSEPFGTTAAENQPTAGQAALPIPLRMPGQMLDTETGLFYNWHRSYDSTTGRYTQSDPIGLDGGINTYAYVRSMPTMRSDPFGLLPGEIPQHESEAPFEAPECKDDDCFCKCLEQYVGGETYVGTGLAASGLPTEPKRFTTPGSSPGTSVASQLSSEALGNRRLPGRMWAPTFMHPGARTISAARLVGRWVPGVGWVMLGVDAYQVYQCKTKCEDEKCEKPK